MEQQSGSYKAMFTIGFIISWLFDVGWLMHRMVGLYGFIHMLIVDCSSIFIHVLFIHSTIQPVAVQVNTQVI